MSAATTSGQDLIASAKLPELASLFSTFSAGHFVRPGNATQPVAAKPRAAAVVAFNYCDVFVAAPLDLDYDEPNAVVEQELELVVARGSIHHLEVSVGSSKTVESRATVSPRIAA